MHHTPSSLRLDSAFAALADPTRRAILARLAVDGEVGAVELGQPFQMSQPAVSRHLKVLEEAGLIVRRVDGTRRPCRLAPEAIVALDGWLDTLRRALERNYDRLDALLADPTLSKRKEDS
jgi:DNA-binding transcriptional ArsR family regulator